MRNRWRKVSAWCGRQWQTLRPGPEARRGAVRGLLIAAAAAVVIVGLNLHTGFSYTFAFALLAAALIIVITALLVALLLTIAPSPSQGDRHHDRLRCGSGVVVMLIWGRFELGVPMAVVIGLAEGFLGATIATMVAGRFLSSPFIKQFVTSLLCSWALIINIGLIWLLVHPGLMSHLVTWKPPAQSMPAKLHGPNPSETGPHRAKTLFYGTGSGIRRPEYGPSVAIRTRTVNASDFFQDFDGLETLDA